MRMVEVPSETLGLRRSVKILFSPQREILSECLRPLAEHVLDGQHRRLSLPELRAEVAGKGLGV